MSYTDLSPGGQKKITDFNQSAYCCKREGEERRERKEDKRRGGERRWRRKMTRRERKRVDCAQRVRREVETHRQKTDKNRRR